jgi:hypothetical protein
MSLLRHRRLAEQRDNWKPAWRELSPKNKLRPLELGFERLRISRLALFGQVTQNATLQELEKVQVPFLVNE